MNVDEVRNLYVWTLAEDFAGCAPPDNYGSLGAAFLRDTRDAFLEAWELGRFDREDDGDVIHEIADGAPDVYTTGRWGEFVDLAAYHEEPEAGEWGTDDLTRIAGIALYQIAERLCCRLLAELREDTSSDKPAEATFQYAGAIFRYVDHTNALGDWCPWSLFVLPSDDFERCPADCPASSVEEVDRQ